MKDRNESVSDELLCHRVAEGDRAAFELLVERHQQRAYRLAWSILGDAEDARDLAQEAFVRLHRAAGKFRGGSRFSTWFHRIVVNLCLDHRRRHRWWDRFVASERSDDEPDVFQIERHPAPRAEPEEEIDRQRRMSTLWKAVQELSPQQRAVVILQVQEGLSTPEIAAAMDCREGTVRVHLHRALSTLKKKMAEHVK